MSFDDWKQPVDKHRIQAVIEQVALTRPLKGGQVQEQGKRLYCAPEDTPLSEARKAADELILRRGGKLPKIREQYISKAWTEKEQAS